MKQANRLLSCLVALMMVLGILPFGVMASETETTGVTVWFSAQNGGAFVFNRQEITVTDGLAEEYGYIVSEKDHNGQTVNGPTVFDALVAVHKAKYGEDFTKESATNYLNIEMGAMGATILKAFEQTGSGIGFFVNGMLPNDGIIGDWGAGCYAADTAVLKEKDTVEFWYYQDMENWNDYYTYFTETEKKVSAGEPFTLTLKGFAAMPSMGYDPDSKAINGGDGYITLHTVKPDGSLSEALTGADGEMLLIDANGQVTLCFEEPGTYVITASGMEGNEGAPIIAPWCQVVVEPQQQQPAPEKIRIACEDSRAVNDTTLLAKTGDTFQMKAYDQDGNETPVTWSTSSSYVGSIEEQSGLLKTTASFSSGSSSTARITAVSKLDGDIAQTTNFFLTGYMFSDYQKTQSVALSEDGQTAKTISVSGGYNGHTLWSYPEAEGIVKLAEGQDLSTKKNSIKFDALRPGTFDATFTLDIDDSMTDTATITITGVAVEDVEGNQTKTYLTKTADQPNPTMQLKAYVGVGRSVASWSSADETIAKVDENGVVTAQGVGSVIITATDSEGSKGGIKVVVQDAVTPYFENLQFLSTAIQDYNQYQFAPTTTEYALGLKSYSTSKLTLQNSTIYDALKYTATAEYTDANGDKQSVPVNSGAVTNLENIPFDQSEITFTLADKTNADNKTVYTFHITRPRDETKTIKSNTGVVLVPEDRELSSAQYQGKPEGTMFRAEEDGTPASGIGITGTHYFYRSYVFDDLAAFSMNLAGTTVYEHLRYSVDDGQNWKELPQGGGKTDVLHFGEGEAKVQIQVLDDKTYSENVTAGKDGFADSTPNTYTIWVQQADVSVADAQILTAAADGGDWYPDFASDRYNYTIVVPEGTSSGTLTYTVAEGATVTLGNAVQTPNEEGVYTLGLKTSTQKLSVTSADGKLVNSYSFALQAKKAGYPDKVVDYLCINSQYTNGIGTGNAAAPWKSLAGTSVSLGGFGGYITYYYEDGLTDNPQNRYGLDFYVYGNANRDGSTSTKTSFFEPGQVWVSENGEQWYALAGSAHYEEGVDWNYTVTYTKTANGKTAWKDNHGNSNDGTSNTGLYPSASVYYMNDLAVSDSLELSGVMLPARNGEVAVSGEAVDAYPVWWGYADCFPNGTIGQDVNPYLDNSNYDGGSNGFDLAWAVDEEGKPVDVSGKEFHYVKIQTVSNIWHTGFGEKSPEIAGVVRTTPQSEAVGKTTAPKGVTITDGVDSKKVTFTEDQQIYSADLGNMKYISLSLDGADETDHIFVNNQRIASSEMADGIKVTKEDGEKLVRILVQNGDKEPAVYYLKLTSEASETDELIEGVKINVSGSSRMAETNDGKLYTASVGYRISSIGIAPVADADVIVSINGASPKTEYTLNTGKNTFTITGEKNGITQIVTLEVTKESAPVSDGTITVYFTLLGDEAHGENGEVHTRKGGGLTTWIARKAYKVDSPATVLDVLEKALDGDHTFVNADGNYISEIDGLAEFDNGPNAGWMFTVNGEYLDAGVAEQKVKNNDQIVFHYTDDFTQEESAADGGGGGTGGGGSNSGSGSGSGGGNNVVTTPGTDTSNPGNPTSDAPFTDIEGHWAADMIAYAYQNGLMTGVSDSAFDPDGMLSRAMLVTVLYRMAGEPATAAGNVFADVAAGEWYTKAVIWANENGIVSGYGDGNFGPNDAITREQLAVIFYRYSGSPAINGTELDGFTDANTVSDYARSAMQWAVQNEIVNGKGDGIIDPAGNATRAETAAIFYRYLENTAQ